MTNKYKIEEYSKEYNSWRRMRDRCRDENHDSYHKYGAKGIDAADNLYNCFTSFIEEVGPMPKDGLRYTLDRVDGSLGYVEGNLRWATNVQQAQNRKITVRNKSGVRGVYKEGNYWTCEIYDNKSNRIRERFSIKEHGDELAFFMAAERRDQLEIILNMFGCKY